MDREAIRCADSIALHSQRTKGVFRMPKDEISRSARKQARHTKQTGAKSGRRRVARKAEQSYVPFSDKLVGSLEDISRVIEENKATMDAIQEIGLALAGAARALQVMAFKYVGMVDRLLDTAVPILHSIPLVPKQTMKTIENLQKLANNIIDVCTRADKVITDVDAGLRNADVAKLNAHTGELQQMTKTLQRVLPQ
jgi:hypothetical protein